MDAQEIAIRQRLKDDFIHYASRCLIIRTESQGLQSYSLNRVQKFIHDKLEEQRRRLGRVKAIILKGRQQGCSTYVAGRFFWRVTHNKGTRVFILTHDADATNNLFTIAQRYYDHCPLLVRPDLRKSNAKELSFDIDSGYKIGTAGAGEGVGRSSTIQYFHGSEVAFWPHAEEHSKGILNSIPRDKGTEIILESTANGIGNYFHEQWQLAESGKSEFIPIFIPWFWSDKYIAEVPRDISFNLTDEEQELIDLYGLTFEQLQWRRLKLTEYGIRNSESAFKQEYPCSAIESFQNSTGGETFISPNLVMRARKSIVQSNGPLIIGVDPAGSGDDRTAIIRRRGRCAYNLQSFNKLEPMELVGIIHKIIEKERPFKVCIDTGNFGIGIYDRLKELGHQEVVIGINSCTCAYDQDKYFNKRAEMWGLLKLWLLEEPCQIPDIDSLHADLCSYNYDESEHVDSKGRLKLEKKIVLKKRNIRSPDEAEALALTFCVPPSLLRESIKNLDNEKASIVMSQLTQIQRIREQSQYKKAI